MCLTFLPLLRKRHAGWIVSVSSESRRSLRLCYSWYDHGADVATEVFEIVHGLVDGIGF
jgi:hypothetical protein